MALRPAWLVLGLAACSPAEEEVAEEAAWVTRALGFARDEGGVSEGFDLDGAVTAAGDAAGCGIPDLTSPDGVPGVDNAFASFLPLIELGGGTALELLVQAAVDSGELLISFEIDLDAGACPSLTVGHADGVPVRGGDGLMLSHQTFDRDPEIADAQGTCVSWDGETVVQELTPLRLALAVFDEWIDLTLLAGHVQMTLGDDDVWRGVIGGGLAVAEIQQVVGTLDGIGDEIPVLVESVLGTKADLTPDAGGTCQDISAVVTFEAVPAFFFDTPPPSDTDG